MSRFECQRTPLEVYFNTYYKKLAKTHVSAYGFQQQISLQPYRQHFQLLVRKKCSILGRTGKEQ